ncbi:GUN4 domain-containing protein [Lyngbya sp. CCY1209]|jgi:hypothetical protein|uniref:GUN4 domain-containing protein n=1 Tax=Lyngbya sp. CCY1209 TaxID=2886103 RepID=UPI002D203F8C|nr:GUN4 domain-containing protein [Lyngbya sp. CCY1209]MEB3881865.1 GUN4 domain-containing protein [Lyngbya sp. CCY1209]
MKCPICETEYTENEIETCKVCGYDLTPYPSLFEPIPPGFLEKERKRIAAAKRVWQLSQSMVSQLQTRLDEVTRQIGNLTESQTQLKSDFQSQLDEVTRQIGNLTESQSQQETRMVEAIASRLQQIVEGQQRPKEDDRRPPSANYARLNNLLKAGNWKAADEETARIMLAVTGQTQRGWVDDDDLKNFPSEDLRTIDQLWVNYSGGRFGFSVQKRIYMEGRAKLYGQYPGDTIWHKFCQQIGWMYGGKYVSPKDLIFDASAPRGHLPCVWPSVVLSGCCVSRLRVGRCHWCYLLSRRDL